MAADREPVQAGHRLPWPQLPPEPQIVDLAAGERLQCKLTGLD